MDAQAIAGARPALSGAKAEASPFVERYLRKGLEAGVELKAVSGATDAAGGYAVPQEIDAEIDRALTAISPIRAIANVVKVGSAGYRKLVTTGGTESGWVAETAARPETDTPVFNEIAPPFGELYANPAASQAMLDDAAFDVEAWLASEIATEFARAEGAAFVSGNGTRSPRASCRRCGTPHPAPRAPRSRRDLRSPSSRHRARPSGTRRAAARAPPRDQAPCRGRSRSGDGRSRR